MKIYEPIGRQPWTIMIIIGCLAFLLGAPSGWAQAAPEASKPAVGAEADVVEQPSNAQAAVDYFYALRNPAPSGAPPQTPVPLAVQAAEAERAAAGQTDEEVQQAGFSPVWRPLGDSVDTGAIPGGGRVSGRVYGIAPDPGDGTGNTLYVATAFGGVWKTTNRGVSWTPLTDEAVSLATSAVVVDPTNPDRVFAATGDRRHSNHSYGSPRCGVPPAATGCTFFGNGLLYSDGGGAPGSWTTIGGAGDADPATRGRFVGEAIYDLAINPDDGRVLYVAATNGLWSVVWDGVRWNIDRRSAGIWYSVRFNPESSNLVHAAGSGGLWVYNRPAGTLTLSAIVQPPPITPAAIGRATIAVDPNDGTHLYASMECIPGVPAAPCPQVVIPQPPPTCSRPPGTMVTLNWWGVYESTDSGASFQPLVAPVTLPPIDPCSPEREFGQSWYDLALGVDPLDGDVLYIGLVNLWAYRRSTGVGANISSPHPPPGLPQDCNAWGRVWAEDGRQRFQLPPGIHCDQHAVSFGPDGTLYAVNDGGVFASPPRSRGGEWDNLNANLKIQQFFPGLSYDSGQPDRLLGGTQDNGTQVWYRSRWQQAEAGDGGFTAFSDNDPANTWLASYIRLALVKTLNGSTPWSETTGPLWVAATQGMALVGSPSYRTYAAVRGALFIAPFAKGSWRSNVLLAGADVPYVSDDGAGHWRDAHGNLAVRPPGQEISATTVCQEGQDTYYFGTANGDVFWSRNALAGAPTWTRFGGPGMGGPTRWITRIVCDWAGGVYVTMGGSALPEGPPERGVHVYHWTRSTNLWEPVRGTPPHALPNTTVATLAIDCESSRVGGRYQGLYAATDLGVYASIDAGATWTRHGGTGLPGSLPQVPVVDLVLDCDYNINILYAATHGRGVWATQLPPWPSLAAITPNQGPAAGGTGVTISGSGFDVRPGLTKFFFNGYEATNVTCASDTSCTANTPPDVGASGFHLVYVWVIAAGRRSDNVALFTYQWPPTINGLDPARGPTSGGTWARLLGTGFSAVPDQTVVRFGGTASSHVTCFNESVCWVIIPPGTGTVPVTVTVDGMSSGPYNFTYYEDATPRVTGVSPGSGPRSGGTPVTVSGLRFPTGPGQVTFGGSSLVDPQCNGVACTGRTPPGNGTVDVIVCNVSGCSEPNPNAKFSYIDADAPRVTGIIPDNGSEFGGTRVTARGANFSTAPGGTRIFFGDNYPPWRSAEGNGVACPSATECSVTSPSGFGTVYVTVWANGRGSVLTPDALFTYVHNTEPLMVTGISPPQGSAAGGTVVTITGQGFDPSPGGTLIHIKNQGDGTPDAGSVSCTPTSCTATTREGAGTVSVVAMAFGQRTPYDTDVQFNYIPQMTRVNPPAGVASGGTSVTLEGVGFRYGPRTSVQFGPDPPTDVVCDPLVCQGLHCLLPQRCIMRVLAGAGGVDVSITVDGYSSPLNPGARFNYIPVVASLQPQVGVTTGGTLVRIGGAGFKPGATTIRFGTAAAAATCDSETECTATSPPGSGTVHVTATVDGQTSATGPFSSFRYVAGGVRPPTVTGIDPGEGPEAGGTTVTITGTGYDTLGLTTVKFGDAPATDVECRRSTQCTATSPPGTGRVHVTVTVGALTSATSTADEFTYVPDMPASKR